MNRKQRRERNRIIRKAVKTGVGVSATVKSWRVIGPDGQVKQSSEEANSDTEQRA